jgi:hypothetical protein
MLFTKDLSLRNPLPVRAMQHSAESRLPAMPHSAEFLTKKCHRRIRAMQLKVEFNSKFYGQLRAMRHSVESTHICEYLCEIKTKLENILG